MPSNAVLSIAGNFVAEHALDAGRSAGSARSRAGEPIPPLPGCPELPPRIGETVRDEVRCARASAPNIDRMPHTDHSRSPIPCHRGRGGGARPPGARRALYRALVRQRQMAKDVVAYVYPLTTGASMLVVWGHGLSGH